MPTPLWKKLGQPEPPIVNGFWAYGTVWAEGQLPPRETRRERCALVRWSYRTWLVKIWKEARGIHYGKTKDQPIT